MTNGSKAATTITQMAKTFTSLCSYADWSASPLPAVDAPIVHKDDIQVPHDTATSVIPPHSNIKTFDLNYDIHIHLPATRDQAVYDALFASLAKHIPLK